MLRPFSLLALLALAASGCTTPPPPVVRYVVTSESDALCCRTLTYRVESAPTVAAKGGGDSVSVAIGKPGAGSINAQCDRELELPVTITNGSSRDIYVPFGGDLVGNRLALYPWREVQRGRSAIRLARQIQQGDRIGGTAGTETRFVRIPAGHAMQLIGVVPGRWICIVPEPVDSFYLHAELTPRYYIDRLRGFRLRQPAQNESIPREYDLAYEVAWTPLDYLDHLPVLRRGTNATGDSVGLMVGVHEEPGTPINASQEVTRSNVVHVLLAPQ